MESFKEDIYYPKGLEARRENTNNSTATSFLDMNLKIVNGQIQMTLFDKRDGFNFEIASFPHADGLIHYRRSHGIVIGQLLRYAKICNRMEHFSVRAKTLTTKLMNQGFDKDLLQQKCKSFFQSRPDLKLKFNLKTEVSLENCLFENISLVKKMSDTKKCKDRRRKERRKEVKKRRKLESLVITEL